MRTLFIAFTVFIGTLGCLHGQDTQVVDSLEVELTRITSDTAKVKILNDLFWELFLHQPDRAGSYAEQALQVAIELNYPEYIADSYNSIGIIYAVKGDFVRSLDNYLSCLSVYELANDTAGMAITYNNIGLTYSTLHKYDIAIDYFAKALKIYRGNGDSLKISHAYNNIGLIYSYKLDTTFAFDYFHRSNRIKIRLGKIAETATGYENMGSLYSEVAVYDKAISNFERALILNIASDNRIGIVYDLRGIGETMIKQDRPGGFVFLDSSLIIAKEMGLLREESEILESLANGYEQNQMFGQALKYFKLYTAVKDTLYNAEKSKDIGRLEAKHEFEQAELDKKRMEADRVEKAKAEEQRRNNLQYTGILIFIAGLFVSIFVLGRLTLPVRLAEGIVFFSFLLLFEFTLVLLDPFIEEYSAGAPAIKLAFNALLAALIFPLHSLFETKLKKRLIK